MSDLVARLRDHGRGITWWALEMREAADALEAAEASREFAAGEAQNMKRVLLAAEARAEKAERQVESLRAYRVASEGLPDPDFYERKVSLSHPRGHGGCTIFGDHSWEQHRNEQGYADRTSAK